jgi:hypothetical protein
LSFLVVVPDPLSLASGAAGVGDEGAVNNVGDLSFE